jgi:hypothetical protein
MRTCYREHCHAVPQHYKVKTKQTTNKLKQNSFLFLELFLPARADPGVGVVLFAQLVRLRLTWKPSSEGLLHCLEKSPNLTLLELGGREGKITVVRSSVTPNTCIRWCRAVIVLLLTNHTLSNAAKAVFRAFLRHNHVALSVLADNLFVNGQLNASIMTLIRKLGSDLLISAAKSYVENGDCEGLFNVLQRLDQLDSYDSSSSLGALVSAITRLLFASGSTFFPRILHVCRPARLPSLLGSLPLSLAQELSLALLADDARLLLSSLLSSLQQNNITLSVQRTLLLKLYSGRSGNFAEYLEEKVQTQFEAMQAVKTPAVCRELFLSLQCAIPFVSSLSWNSLSCCHICDAPGILDKQLLSRFVCLLPSSLSSFSIRYSIHVRSPILSLDDSLLLSIVTNRPLVSLMLDLTPAITNAGLKGKEEKKIFFFKEKNFFSNK